MPYRAHLLAWTRYNRWAHGRLFDALESAAVARGGAAPGAYAALLDADRALPLRSIRGTLNHALIAEQLLFVRAARGMAAAERVPGWHAARAGALWAGAPGDGQWGGDLWLGPAEGLRGALDEQAARLERLVAALGADDLGAVVSYTRTDGTTQALARGHLVGHIVNHSTHHRGQVTAALTALGAPPPVLDFPLFAQEKR